MRRLPRYLNRFSCLAACSFLLALPAWSTSRGGSDYGVSALTTCGTDGPFNGVTATCFNGGGGFPNDFLFNFTLTSPLHSTSVTSFTIDLPAAPDDYGLVVGPCPGGLPVACASDYSVTSPPPFTVTGTASSGVQTFDFTGFTGDLSGSVTVFFSYSSPTSTPAISNISATTTTATPEPGSAVLFSAGLALCFALQKLGRKNRTGRARRPA